MRTCKREFYTLLFTNILITSVLPAAPYHRIVEQAREHVTRTQTMAFNQDLHLTLTINQAIQLNCPENNHDLACFLVYYYEVSANDRPQQILRTDAVFSTGATSGGGSRVSSKASLRQAGYSRCLVITEWEVQGNTVQMTWRASDDLAYNHGIYQRWTAEGRHFSKMYKDRQLLPAVELTEVERIAGFVRLWSEVKYNFAFFDQVPEIDWDGVLSDYLPKIQAAHTDVAYYRVLRQCIALLQDGHTSVWGPDDRPSCELPFRVECVEGMAIVTQISSQIHDDNERLKREWAAADLHLGDAITHIDGRTVTQILTEELYPTLAASTSQGRDLDAYEQLLHGAYGSSVALTIERLDGSQHQESLSRSHFSFPRSHREFTHKILPGDIHYVNLSSFGSDQVVCEFDRLFDQIKKASGLILDVRGNGGGSTRHGYAILSRLIDQKVRGSHWKTPQHIAAFKAWGREPQWHEGDHSSIKPHPTQHYSGPVVLLIGPETCSAAEDFVVAFQTSGRGQTMGQKTRGTTGQPLVIDLPGGGGARICTKRDTYPDGREFVGIGCIPDIEIAPTRRDIAQGNDPVLDKAIELLSH